MKKNNTIKTLCLAAAMFFGAFAANAQIEQTIYLNGSVPTAEFGQSVNLRTSPSLGLMGRDTVGKGATAGFGLGYRISYHFDIGYGEVSPFANIDVQWNRLKSSYRDQYTLASADKPEYFNIPMMVGVNYRYGLTDIIKVFGEFGVGFDIFNITAEGWGGSETSPYYRYDVGNAMAWELGAGAYLNDYFSAGLYYYALGKHAISYDSHSHLLNGEPTSPILRNIGSLALRLGFHF